MTSIADIGINFLTGIINNLLSKLPLEYANLPIADFHNTLTTFALSFSNTFNAIDFICPAWLVIAVFGIIIGAEITLLGFKAGLMIANLFRGSGA